MLRLKGLIGKGLEGRHYSLRYMLGVLWKTAKKLVRMAGGPANIQTGHLKNVSRHRDCNNILLSQGMSIFDILSL
jgi:hypothetical protein